MHCLGVLPHMSPPVPDELARHLDVATLMRWLEPVPRIPFRHSANVPL